LKSSILFKNGWFNGFTSVKKSNIRRQQKNCTKSWATVLPCKNTIFIAYISLLNTNIAINLIDLSSSVLTFKYSDSNRALKSSSYSKGLLFFKNKYIPGGNETIQTKNMTVIQELIISSRLLILKC
jgi:hypothetical protein